MDEEQKARKLGVPSMTDPYYAFNESWVPMDPAKPERAERRSRLNHPKTSLPRWFVFVFWVVMVILAIIALRPFVITW